MYVPTIVQPTSANMWSNPYPIAMPASTEVIVQEPQSTSSNTTTTKTTTTRILDPSALPTATDDSFIEETTTTTTKVTKSDPPVETTYPSQVTIASIQPTIETTVIREKPRYQSSPARTPSTSTSSSASSTSTEPTTPFPTVAPVPIQTANILPVRRVVHRPTHPVRPTRPVTPSGYYSSDLDYGKRRVYKTDYKYRHYYCCNFCRGRWDLHNRSYSCCEWFYGCPLWIFPLLAILFLALLVGFFTLLGLQPGINASRRTETAQTRVLNRTEVVYGFYRLCGFQVNATFVSTTLILCTNTPTATTARLQLSSFYTVLNRTHQSSSNAVLILFLLLISLRHVSSSSSFFIPCRMRLQRI